MVSCLENRSDFCWRCFLIERIVLVLELSIDKYIEWQARFWCWLKGRRTRWKWFLVVWTFLQSIFWLGESCWWTIHPASKQRSEGEKVRFNDDVILVSVFSERYLVRNKRFVVSPWKSVQLVCFHSISTLTCQRMNTDASMRHFVNKFGVLFQYQAALLELKILVSFLAATLFD